MRPDPPRGERTACALPVRGGPPASAVSRKIVGLVARGAGRDLIRASPLPATAESFEGCRGPRRAGRGPLRPLPVPCASGCAGPANRAGTRRAVCSGRAAPVCGVARMEGPGMTGRPPPGRERCRESPRRAEPAASAVAGFPMKAPVWVQSPQYSPDHGFTAPSLAPRAGGSGHGSEPGGTRGMLPRGSPRARSGTRFSSKNSRGSRHFGRRRDRHASENADRRRRHAGSSSGSRGPQRIRERYLHLRGGECRPSRQRAPSR